MAGKLHRRNQQVWIQAEQFGWVEASSDDKDALPKCTMLAYTGKAVDVGWGAPVVFDLDGITHKKSIPLLLEHNRSRIVGHSISISKDKDKLSIEGAVSAIGVSEAADLVTVTSRNKYPWQSSVGLFANKYEFVREGQTTTANNRTFKGPCYCVRRSSLTECSFVSLGADDDTISIVASNAQDNNAMTFTEWLSANYPDITLANLSAVQASKYAVEFGQEHGDGKKVTASGNPDSDGDEGNDGDKNKKSGVGVPAIHAGGAAPAGSGMSDADLMSHVEKVAQAIRQREREVLRLCGSREHIAAAILDDEAKGIKWTDQQIKDRMTVEDIQAGRPTPPRLAGQGGSPSNGNKTIQAAMLLGSGTDETFLIKHYGQQVVEAADKMRGIGLRGAVELHAANAGVQMPNYYTSGHSAWVQAAASLVDLPAMFRDTLERSLLALYERAPPVGPTVVRNGSVKDFRKTTRYRLDGGDYWKELSHNERIESTVMGDQKPYEVQITSFGQMLEWRRKDIVNDDLSAMPQCSTLMVRGWGYTIDRLLGLHLWSKTNFAAGDNYFSGADKALALTILESAWDEMIKTTRNTTRNHKLTHRIRPKYVIHSATKERLAEMLLMPDNFVPVGGATPNERVNPRNFLKGKLMPKTFEEQSNTSWFKATADASHYKCDDDTWWMLADPDGIYCPFEYNWLNGRRTPVVESEPAPFENLGFRIRGYGDVGLDALEARKGASMYQPVP